MATGIQFAGGGPVPAYLATGSVLLDTALGIGIAVVLFALFYRLILGPARRARANQNRTERTTGRDAGN